MRLIPWQKASKVLSSGATKAAVNGGLNPSAKNFIRYIEENSHTLTKTPVFWKGKFGRKGAKHFADEKKNDPAFIGSFPGFTLFDVLETAEVPKTEYLKWKYSPDWQAISEAFARHVTPVSRSARLIQGPEFNLYTEPDSKISEHVKNLQTPVWKSSKYLGDPDYLNVTNWVVENLDPRGTETVFVNEAIDPDDASYDPPKGFTAGDIFQRFKGAKEIFESEADIQELIDFRDKHGTLDGK